MMKNGGIDFTCVEFSDTQNLKQWDMEILFKERHWKIDVSLSMMTVNLVMKLYWGEVEDCYVLVHYNGIDLVI